MSDAVHPDVESAPPRVQFGLRTLLALPVVFAVVFPLVKCFNAFGLLAVFAATVALQWIPFERRSSALRRVAVDLAWGIVMPVLCLLYDPMFFREAGWVGILGYLAIGTQMLWLLVWLTVGARACWLAGILAGALSVGVGVAVLVGVLLLPMSVIGTLAAVIGLLGFTPWFTAWIFWRNAADAYRFALQSRRPRPQTLVPLGAAAAAAVPVLLYFACGEPLAQLVQTAHTLWKLP
jgi:hypothetical protein